METSKIIQLGTDYLSDYFMELFLIFKNPKVCFQPILETKLMGDFVLNGISPEYQRTKLNPKIFGFMAISIFIGSLFTSLFPTYVDLPSTTFWAFRPLTYSHVEPPGTLELMILTVTNWFFSSVIVYAVCLLLRVKVRFWDLATVFLQVQASIYVVSSFVAFLWTMTGNSIARLFGFNIGNDMIGITLQNPAVVYYAIHLILTLIYIPLALGSLHTANVLKLVAIAFVPAICLTLFLLPSIRGQWTWIAYCEPCRLQAINLRTVPDVTSLVEQYRREAITQILLRIVLGLVVSTAFIFGILVGRKRLSLQGK